ncbi:MAG: hypothetical protein WCF63_01740 [Acidimicrobiales bacterium]
MPRELARPGVIANRHRRRALVVVALGVVALVTSAYASPKGEGGAGLASHSTNPRFNAISFSFDSPANGWALGLLPCAKATGCLALRETLDHGRSWSPRSLPAALVALSNKNTSGSGFKRDGALSIFFADAQNGWIYGLERGRPVFFSTHDGGAQWRQLSTSLEGPYGVIFDIAATRGTAYLVAQSRSFHGVVERSAVGRDDWRRVRAPTLELPAGGATDGGAIVFRGTSGWLVVGNDRGVSGSARLTSSGQWVKWSPPCAPVGDSYVVPVATTARDLVVACEMGGFASPLSKSAPPGATLQSVWLYTSRDDGRTFHYGPQLSPSIENILAAPTATDLFANRVNNSVSDVQQFIRSVDGGHHWEIVRREWALSLAFQSVAQGVALLQGARDENTMIMTSDGGVHWAAVVP